MEYRRGRSLMERWTPVLSPNSLGLERVKRARQAERTISSKANNTSCKSSFLERCAHAATPFLSSSLEDDFSVSSSLGLIARAHTHTRVRLLSFLSYSLFSPFPFSISSIVHLSPLFPFRLWRKTNLSITFLDRFRGKLEGKRKKKNLTISFNSRLSKAHCRRRRRRRSWKLFQQKLPITERRGKDIPAREKAGIPTVRVNGWVGLFFFFFFPGKICLHANVFLCFLPSFLLFRSLIETRLG